MQVMLLAAGLGTRLWPLTSDRAKPAVPFLGKPLVRWVLELALRHGFERIVVNTHHRPESVREALAGADPERVRFSHEAEILGTAGALAKARAEGLLRPGEPTMVINAKLFTDLDLTAVRAAHERAGGLVTMVLRPNVEREHFREVLVEDGRVVGFGRGRVPEGPSPLLFTGIHVLEPEVVERIPLCFSDTVADVYPPLIEGRRVAAHVEPRGRWWELSTLERYLGLHQEAARAGLGPEVACSPGAVITPGAVVARSVLWEDARVEAGAIVEDAVLGRGVVVPAGAHVAGAVVMQRARVEDPERGEPWGDDQLLVRLASGPAIGPRDVTGRS